MKGEVAVGRPVKVEAFGLTPNTNVRIVMRSEPIVLGEKLANSEGSATFLVSLPSTIEVGAHTLAVEATDSNGSQLLSVAAFAVDEGGLVTDVIPAGMVEDLPNEQEILRALELDRALHDPRTDPVTTAALVVGAVALLSLAGAGALGSSTLPSNGGGSNSNTSEPAREQSRKRAKLGSVVTKKLKALSDDGEGSTDRGRTWKFFGGFEKWVIRASAVGRVSPMLQRVLLDGSWIRAIFGGGGILFWLLGGFLGFFSSQESHWTVVPLSTELFVAIIVLGMLDATSGLIAWLVTVLLALLHGNLSTWVDVRTALGLGICYFSLPLLAHAIRPLRRKLDSSTIGRFDRVADYVMPPVFVAFAGISMIKALDGLSQLKVIDSSNYDLIRIIIGVALILRLAGEDIVAKFYSKRMLEVQPTKLVSSPLKYQSTSLFLRTLLFLLLIIPYFGFGIITFFAAILTFLPQVLKLREDKLPNLVSLNRWYPRGLFKFFVFLLIGMYLSIWLLGSDPSPETITKTFPLLLLPSFIGSMIELFGREGANWKFEWQKRALGALVWIASIGLVTGVISLTA